MTEKEYLGFLDAVAKRHLRLHRIHHGPEGAFHRLEGIVEGTARTSRFVRVVAEHHSKTALYQPLGQELTYAYLDFLSYSYEEAGVAEALDEHGAVIFGGLTRAAIPDADSEFLRRAGVEEPEAELTITIHWTRRLVASSRDVRASQIVEDGKAALKRAAEELRETPLPIAGGQDSPKPKKYFNGIGKILSGTITGAGNLLLGIGAMPSAGAVAPHLVLGSCALAVGAIAQGIGDLRGE